MISGAPVIHGGTGFPDWAVPPAIERGVCKFNVGTSLKQAFLYGVRAALAGVPPRANVHHLMGSREESDILTAGKAGVKREIVRLSKLYGCAGRAADWQGAKS